MVPDISQYAHVKKAVDESLALLPREPYAETVSARRSYGRVSAEDVRAQADVPLLATSHMDGFAIRARDTTNASRDRPVKLRVVGEVGIGKKPRTSVGEGEAVRVSTGSFLPEGADAVVPVEEARTLRGRFSVESAVAETSFVFRAGEDVKRGEVVVRKGAAIRAQDVGFLVALGIRSVKAYVKPTVALLATGNELTNSAVAGPGKTRNSHVPMFRLMAKKLGCDVVDLGIAKDNRVAILRKLRRGLRKADIVFTTGGTSVGTLDLAEDVVSRLGPRVLHHGIRMDRGRVAGLAVVKGKPVVMMPGPIQGAMNAFVLLGLPMIRRLSGGGDFPSRVNARLTRRWEARRRFPNFTKVLYLRIFPAKGGLAAEPMLGETESMSLLIRSNALSIVPEEVRSMEAGQEVEVLLLPGFFSPF